MECPELERGWPRAGQEPELGGLARVFERYE